MDEKKRIDRILDAIESRIQDEVGALLGTDFDVASSRREIVSKEKIFEELKGKQICAKMDITGDVAGAGCLLIGIKDAIRLGGTLIMLPESELIEVVGREDYSEEIEDSYGEIANIIAGSFTKDFEEMYPKSCRFIRKEQEILVPLKVETSSDQPVPDQQYYLVASSMTLAGESLGDILMLMPAESFGLVDGSADDAPAVDTASNPEAEESPSAKSTEESSAPETPTPSEPEASSVPPQKSKFNVEKHKGRVDRLLEACREQLAVEVGGLLGVDVDVTDIENRLLSKEDFFFDTVNGKQVLSDMEIVGDRQDLGYLCVSVKDAIHMGGVLIMLPPSELEAVVAEEDFGEDAKDAYGEVANIISGVYTAVFEEQYTEKLRIIRKEFATVVPAKVEIESEEPIPDRKYYVSSMGLVIDGSPLGQLHMLFPAEVLRLETYGAPVVEETAASKVQPQAASQDQTSGESEDGVVAAEPKKPKKAFDIEKHRKRVDGLLETCREKIGEEVGALLGCDVKLSNLENSVISKEDLFYEELRGKQIMADLEVVGDKEGKASLFVDLRDAIRIGGTLIMLPNSELETAISEEEFGEDTKDAYGEIANIIAGVYTAIFEEQYTKQIRFIRRELELIKPMKVDIESDIPFEDGEYYLSRMDLVLGESSYGKVRFLVPLELMELGGLGATAAPVVEEPVVAPGQATPAQSAEPVAEPPDVQAVRGTVSGLDVLLIGDDLTEAQKIAEILTNSGYVVKTLTFKDDLHAFIPGELKAVYIVMKQVNEQAFGAAIKVSAVCSVPIIAAGPEWTRTKVIKAWKYGVRDILLTPSTESDIQETVNNNLMQMAA